ncbi:MAG: hypothetical protein IKD29_06260, partial [Lentisphaeria bacterium]|nr:hypothetical protein [Lentisphaeria bacterium]
FRFLKPDCVAWLLSNNRKRLLPTFPRFCNCPFFVLILLLSQQLRFAGIGRVFFSCFGTKNTPIPVFFVLALEEVAKKSYLIE